MRERRRERLAGVGLGGGLGLLTEQLLIGPFPLLELCRGQLRIGQQPVNQSKLPLPVLQRSTGGAPSRQIYLLPVCLNMETQERQITQLAGSTGTLVKLWSTAGPPQSSGSPRRPPNQVTRPKR